MRGPQIHRASAGVRAPLQLTAPRTGAHQYPNPTSLHSRRRRERNNMAAAAGAADAVDTTGAADNPPSVVICGAGIIGAATAYYLAKLGVAATVIEPCGAAAAASGKAGGFLALDWNDSSPVGPLSRTSFALHEELAAEFGAEAIGYRRVETLRVVAVEDGGLPGARPAGVPDWVDGDLLRAAPLGTRRTTAQVHPPSLTRALLDAAVARGAKVVRGAADGIYWTRGGDDDEGAASTTATAAGVLLSHGELLPATAVVIAMGPWSRAARDWLPFPHVTGTRYTSIVLRPAADADGGDAANAIGDTCLFTTYRAAGGGTAGTAGTAVEPDIYPRPDGTVYVCGEPQDEADSPLPASAADVLPDPERAARVRRVAAAFVSRLGEGAGGARVEATQACYLPLSSDGVPVIGALPGVRGAYAATGHSCWGILNAPATGLGLAELIVHGAARSVDLAPFSPARLARELSALPSATITRSRSSGGGAK